MGIFNPYNRTRRGMAWRGPDDPAARTAATTPRGTFDNGWTAAGRTTRPLQYAIPRHHETGTIETPDTTQGPAERADHQLQAANALVDQAVRITTIGADLLKTKADVLNRATAMLETRPFAGERLRSELQAITQDLAQIDGPIAALQLESADLLARAVDQYDLAARLFQEAGQPDMAALCLKSAADTCHGTRHQAQIQAEGAGALGLSESPP